MDRREFVKILVTGTAGTIAFPCSAEPCLEESIDETIRQTYQLSPEEPTMVLLGKETRLSLFSDGFVRSYDVAIGRNGLGNSYGSRKTPTGLLRIANKLGAGKPLGTRWYSTTIPGGVMTTRVMGLAGLEEKNRNAMVRGICLHGTPDEKSVPGRASHGCIRMRNRDVMELFEYVKVGTYLYVYE